MNVSESNDLNKLLEWLLSIETPYGSIVTEEYARGCAARLADKAYARLSAGVDADDVEKRWVIPGSPCREKRPCP